MNGGKAFTLRFGHRGLRNTCTLIKDMMTRHFTMHALVLTYSSVSGHSAPLSLIVDFLLLELDLCLALPILIDIVFSLHVIPKRLGR